MMSTLLDNRYQIVRVLGSGGFGETFLAEDTKMPSRPYCVIKQLRPIVDKPEVYQLVQQRFIREAAVLEELGASCHQIPCLYANFTENEQFFLVQEWVEGPTLLEKVKSEGKQSEQFTRQILTEVLHILDYVHGRGMIHRDIKPDNIILRDSDRLPVLIDFGAVKETVSNPANKHQTTKSIIVGTPGFMASEQSVGRPIFASDLYGLGMTAIYLLTGKLPRDLTTDPHTAEILWREHAGDISESLAHVLEKAVHFYPRDRYANARAMLRALGNETPSRKLTPKFLATTSNTPSQIQIKRRRKAAIAGFLIFGTLAGSGMALGLPLLRNFYQSQLTAQPSTPANPNLPVAVQSDSFYFLADSAYVDASTAEQYAEALKTNGFNQAGVFKLSDYANLKQPEKVQVYVAKFDRISSCVAQLKLYVSQKPEAYCALASTDVSQSTEQVLGSTLLAAQTPKQPEPKPALAAATPEQAVREYYDLINNQNYETAWQKLSPGFQQSRAKNGFKNSYVAWWEEIDRVEINQASLISRGTDRAKVNAELTYYKKNGDITPESLQVFLVWDNSHGWVFDDTRVR
jgi:serine/threonine protein kinase, bacterial